MKEQRTIQSKFELRSDEGKPEVLSGLAAVVNSPTVIMEFNDMKKKEIFREVIMPGAFDDVINDDVRALFNHKEDNILGRTKAGTLRLAITPDGHLGYEVDLPDTTLAKDLKVSVKRGDISQSSFGFNVKEDLRTREETETEIIYTRSIKKLSDLYDVSPVTFPAYEDTVTTIRTEQLVKELRSIGAVKPEAEVLTPNLNKSKIRLSEIKNSL
jgi:uncharacterized protein